MLISLQWYRDKGDGQRAADDMSAQQVYNGSWPIATLACATNQEASDYWQILYTLYGVNANTVYRDGERVSSVKITSPTRL